MMVKQLRPVDFRSSAGTMLRGKNVYKGGTPAATVGPKKPRNPKKLPTAKAIDRYMMGKM